MASENLATSGATAELDAALVDRCRSNDAAAFNAVVARHKARVFRFVCRMVGPGPDADDLAQETFVKAYTSLAGFRGSASLTTWLFRIAGNLCIDYRRRRKHGPARAVSLTAALFADEGREGPSEPRDPRDGPEAEALRGELRGQVYAAIDALPDKLRMVVLLYDIEGLTYDEISQVVGCPMGTVKSRLFSARCSLRSALSAYMGDLALATSAHTDRRGSAR
ncbi:MAG: sigma-70 family RNA polymerase sigma factor [Armatimonadetes bacterium]|nr:sigma-70 family RNA polymerase sigma factor [Armatimonadota bacterium]